MKVVLIAHLKIRLRERKIPKNYPRIIIQNYEQKYKDMHTGYFIAIKNMEYKGKLRSMVVAYDIIESVAEAITIYPTTRQEIENKLKRKRWIKNEEK